MGGHKTISGSTSPLSRRTADYYKVTGILNPDDTGNYYFDSVHDGKSQYRIPATNCYLWWASSSSRYYIGTSAMGFYFPHFENISENILGNYTPVLPSTGIALVLEGFL